MNFVLNYLSHSLSS